MSVPRLQRARSLALAGAIALPILTLGARATWAQEVNNSLGVTFASASAGEDGYVHANLTIDYALHICSGTVRLSYGVRPGSVQGSTTYWYKGHNYGVPSGAQPPQAPFLTTETRVRFGAQAVYTAVKRDPSVTTNLGCGGPQWIGLGSVSKYDKEAKTPSQLQDVLNRFTFDVGLTRDPLRGPAVESALARQLAAAAQRARQGLAQARRDSLNRVAKARQDSAQAARAAAASASKLRGSGAVTQSGASAATVGQSGAAANTSAGTNGQRAEVNQDRQADAAARERDAAARDAAARQRQVAAVQQMLAEQQAAEEARTQAVDEAATQIGAMVGGIFAERQRNADLRDAREAAAAERKYQYQLRARARYFASPERPRCTDADETEALTLDKPTAGVLSLETCRLADSTSAVLYEFVLDKSRTIAVTVGSSNFYGLVQLERADSVIAKGNRSTPIDRKLPAGRYRIVVKSEALGETGGYTVMAHRSVLSKVPGVSYGFVFGYRPTPFSGQPAKQEEGGLRLGLGFGSHLMLMVLGGTGSNDEGVDETFVQYGARGYLGHPYTQWRPFVQVLMGTYKYDRSVGYSTDKYQGNATSFGGGVEWFGDRRLGMELGVYQNTGSISMPGSTSSVSLSSTYLRMGMTFHK